MLQRSLTLVLALVLVATFSAMAWRLHGLLSFQQNVRAAQTERALALNAQLDLETGLRGYVSTGDRRFLQPYTAAEGTVQARFDMLARAIRTLYAAPSVQRVVADERAQVERWLRDIAGPSLRSRSAGESARLQLAGKRIVDGVRRDDALLRSSLEDEASRADAGGVAFLWQIGIAGLGVAALSSLLLAVVSRRQSEASRALEVRTAEYEAEKRIADTLSEFFAQSALPATTNIGVHAAYVPAEDQARVGGDWYDCFELPDGRLMVVVGDVTGHGLDAAVSMARARQILLGAALHETQPHVVLQRANRTMLRRREPIVTAVCGFVDPMTHAFSYACAGHPPPIVVRRDGSVEMLPYGGVPLGIDDAAQYETRHVLDLAEALLVLYTDGLIEHKRDAVDGERRLVEAASAAWRSEDDGADVIRARMLDAAAHDDVAILTLRFSPSEGAAVRIETLQKSQVLYQPGAAPHAEPTR